RPAARLERQDSLSSAKRGSVVGRNLNRFSSFVRSGVEAFVLGDVPLMSKVAELYYIEMGSRGPQWRANPHPFLCSVEDPTKQTKFKGIKSYISYKLTPSNINSPVYRRYKHFDWLYNRLLHKFTVISVPHLPEKQATGRFEEDFIEKRKRRLVLWMEHMTSHPVLSQYEGFQHFLRCRDEKQWKLGKRRAEKDEMVGASFLLTLQIPTEHQDLQDVEDRVDAFKAFSKKMDDSVLQLTNVASELARKHVGGFRKEFHKLGSAFQAISHSFHMDPPYSSDALNNAISHTGKTYETVGEMFAEQPKNDLFLMLDTLSLYQGLLSNFPDIIHLQKGAFAKVKESQRMSDEGRMDQDEADGIRKRCRVVGFALQAEMNHFHERRVADFKRMMQSYLKQQIIFYQRVSQQLEKTLRMYDNL
ncbi:SNX33 protein, partial [Eudromia elegans]|nr:SNX33 protein [Eudromia elegans]